MVTQFGLIIHETSVSLDDEATALLFWLTLTVFMVCVLPLQQALQPVINLQYATAQRSTADTQSANSRKNTQSFTGGRT